MNLESEIIVVHNDFFVHSTFVHDPVDKSNEFDIFVYMPKRVESSFVSLSKLFQLMCQVS